MGSKLNGWSPYKERAIGDTEETEGEGHAMMETAITSAKDH